MFSKSGDSKIVGTYHILYMAACSDISDRIADIVINFQKSYNLKIKMVLKDLMS